MSVLTYRKLRNDKLTLLPLLPEHRESLFQVSQDERIWEWTLSSAMGQEAFNAYFDRLLEDQASALKLPFVVMLSDKQVVGVTCYLDIDLEHQHLEIGATWYSPEVWGTFVNPSAKYLLLKNAFESADMNRVSLYTDLRNLRSQRAIEKLGAQKEGVLRSHLVSQGGYVRDSVLYGITRGDWEHEVKKLLEAASG